MSITDNGRDTDNGEAETSAEALETPDTTEAAVEEQLFDDGDESLPWLEDDEDYEEERGIPPIVLIGLGGLLVVALLLGLVWWFSREQSDAALVADGSTIAAPDTPYKEKPADPGGKTFEGTGDTSFAVGEGQTREGRIANTADATPGFDEIAEDVAPEAAATPAPPAGDGVGVQVGAYQSREAADRGWQELTRRYSALQGVKHRVVEGQAEFGRVFRLQAVAGSRSAANDLCDALKAAGGACQVK